MTINVKIVNLDKVKELLKTASDDVKKNVDKGIKEAGFFIQTEIQESIAGHRAEIRSFDTGRFASSIKATFPKQYVAIVGTDVDYAKFLEYGTSKIEPRSHFRNTVARNEDKVKLYILKEIKTSL